MRVTPGIRYSALLHGAILFLLLFGLPDFLHREHEAEPIAISVDILPIAPISNVKPHEKAPEKEPKKPAEKNTAKKAVTQAKKEAPEEKPEPISAKQVVKEEKKKPEKQKEKSDADLESVLKSVKDTAKADQSKEPAQKAAPEKNAHEAKSDRYNAALPLSMSEKDAIRNQFQKCWTVPAGAKDAADLVVTLHIEVTEAGAVTKVELAKDEGRYASDSYFRAAADSAIRAVNRCSPLKDLPNDKYGSWRDMELTFNPKDMLF